MRKILLSITLLVASVATINAQTVLTSHFEGALTNPASPKVGIYNYPNPYGYVSGNNQFGDEGIIQLFDSSYGVTGEGVINSISVSIWS